MRRLCFGMALILVAAAARAEDAAEQPILILNTGGHTAPITKVLFTNDGKEVITVSQDKTVRRWDAATGERLGVFRLPAATADQGKLGAGALSPDGQTLAVGGANYKGDGKRVNLIYLIDLAIGRVSAVLHRPGGEVHSLAFSHDGKRLAAGIFGQAYLLDVASDQLLHTLKGPDVEASWLEGLAFSPDDKLLALHAGNQANATLWSVETGTEVCPPMKKGSVFSVAWKDDDTLATGEGDFGGVSLWDHHGKLLRHFDKLPGNPRYIGFLSFLPGKKALFYSYHETYGDAWEYQKTGGAILNLTSPEKSHEGASWEHHTAPTTSAVSPDGLLAATSDGFGVNLWTVKDGKLVRRLAGRGQSPYGAGWSLDGRVVAWTNGYKKEGLQRAFDLGELHFAKKPDAKFVRAAHKERSDKFGELHADMGEYFVKVVGGKGKEGALATIKTNHNVGAHCYTFLPGDRLALGLYDNVLVYDAPAGKLLRTLQGATGTIWDLAPSPDGRYLLGAFSDQTLRIWDPDKPQPLLSLFVAGADWVAWTRKGYYAASPAGEKLMGWQVNNGLDQLGTFYPAAQFHKAFYRPDVISRVLTEGSVAKALEAADKANGTTTAAVDLSRALPPDVQIVAPVKDDPETADVTVQAVAESKDRPVVSLRLLLDGRPYPDAEVKKFPAAKAGDKQEATWAVKKPEGDHVLSVLAESDVSSAASKEVAVAYRPAAAPEPLPTLYVVAVGINAYPGSLKLNWAVEDAAAIAKAFQADAAPKPFGKVDVKLLLDKDATREGILAGLDSLKGMTADDTAVVFYAGHGHRDKKTGQFYMLPVDVDVKDLPGTGVTGTEIKKRLQAAQGRVLVLLDACHSGSIGQSPADPGSLTDDVQRQLAAPDCGAVIMCAAMAQEEAGEAAAVKHGFFTAALLSGLGGAAPPSKDGFIHLTALNFYVEEQVSELSKDEQHVVVDRPSTVTSFPLVRAEQK